MARFRGNSAFYNSELMTHVESMNGKYFIRAKGYRKLQEKVMEKIYANKINPDDYTSHDPYDGETRYAIGKSEQL